MSGQIGGRGRCSCVGAKPLQGDRQRDGRAERAVDGGRPGAVPVVRRLAGPWASSDRMPASWRPRSSWPRRGPTRSRPG